MTEMRRNFFPPLLYRSGECAMLLFWVIRGPLFLLRQTMGGDNPDALATLHRLLQRSLDIGHLPFPTYCFVHRGYKNSDGRPTDRLHIESMRAHETVAVANYF